QESHHRALDRPPLQESVRHEDSDRDRPSVGGQRHTDRLGERARHLVSRQHEQCGLGAPGELQPRSLLLLYKIKVGTALPTASDQAQFYHVEGASASQREGDWPPLAPFAERYTVMGVTPVIEPVTLYGCAPHMHL